MITFEAYDIVLAESLEGLVKGVNEYFEQNFRTVGHPFQCEREVNEKSVTLWAQAVCRLAPPPEMSQVYTGEG